MKKAEGEGKERGVSQAEEEACANSYGRRRLGPLKKSRETLVECSKQGE